MRGPRWFWGGLAFIGVIAFAVRVAYVDIVASGHVLPFDGQYNHDVANGFVNGQGWIDQNLLHLRGVVRPTAYFPPLFGLVLAAASWLGADSVHAHQILSCVIGVAGVVIAGLLGRVVASPAVGLVAAGLAAIHPLLFGITGALMSETLYIPLVGAAVLAVYIAKRTPSFLSFAAVGALCGLAALTRSDGLGLALVLGVPLVVSVRALGRRAWKLAGAALLALLVVLAPWTIRNALTFEKPVMISNNSGTLIGGANCDITYYGAHQGRWALQCPGVAENGDDESALNTRRRNLGIRYALDHLQRLPYVALLRVARTWAPPISDDQSEFEVAEGRDAHWQWLGELLYVAGIPFAVAGVVALRRRKVMVWPLLAPLGFVCLVSAASYGSQRFRAAAELPLIVLTAVGIAATSSWALRLGRRGDDRELIYDPDTG
ncbi:MAG: glycosyltransferase family 39 protein [Acidimicrobiia bacterium]